MIAWWKINISNKSNSLNLLNSFNNKKISEGVVNKSLEKKLSKLLKVKYVSMFTSGSVALLAAMMSCELKENDEIIIPNCGWISPIHAAIFLKLKIKLIDVESERPVMNLDLLKKNITKKTKAIVPIHLNGMAVDIKKIKKIIGNKKILIIEDAAQALYSKLNKKFLGTEGTIGCFSFSVSKLVTTGQGGFCCTNNKKIYEKIKLIKTHGMSNIFNSSWNKFGFNFRYSDLLASLAIQQIDNIQKTVKRLNIIHNYYDMNIINKKINFLKVNINKKEVPIYNLISTKYPQLLIKYLKKFKVEARPWYKNFFDKIDYYKFENKNKKFINSNKFENLVIIPSGPDQNFKDIKKVVNLLNKY